MSADEPILDRQREFSGVRPVREAHRLDVGALEAYLREVIAGFEGPLEVSQFKGGQSNPTYFLTARSGRYVLRRKPPGKLLPSAHAVDREYRVVSALHELGFPVARPYLLCTDEGVVGTQFYVMEYVSGRVIWIPHIPGVSAQERSGIFDSLNATIAALHAVDYRAAGLSDFGKPEGYVARQVKRWSEQYRASETEKIAEMDRLMEWLPTAAPSSGQHALVHGDFRLDNCILDEREPRVRAVLDWELSTIGDPIADFTYHLMQWRMPPAPSGSGVGSLVGHEGEPGLPSLDDYVARYCQRRGLAGIPDLDIYLAYNFFRLAAIFQGIVGRVRDGTAANPNAARMAEHVRPMAEVAWSYARKAGA
jgi:aminoglycoside phosphotransferase (APT) family kinase protein